LESDYFDIKLIIELLQVQEPERKELIEEVKRMTPLRLLRKKYVYFVDSAKPN